jgi:UDP-GlcNAc:undecaprenyl-phosphate/decaprenyl-phosphate GlcNAc-1-phosphate transferase
MDTVRPYLLVFAASAGVTFAITPVVRRLSLRLGWIDRPSDRKVHPNPTPTAGGIAMYAGVAAGLLAARLIPFLSDLHESSSELDAAFVAATVVVVLGVIDDTRGVTALGKLAGQVLAAGLVVLLGVQLLYFYFPGPGVVSPPPDVAVPLTVLWIVALMNAVNLVDGLDGLAAGMVAIAAIAFFAYFRTPTPDGTETASVAALMSTIVAGVAIGFLPWNFHPAKIFMGDSGSLMLGLLMAVATISGVGQNLDGPTGGDVAVIAIPILIPLLVLAVPLLDVVLAIIRRMRKGIGIAHADKEHIHHRLMDIGHSHRQAVLLMYLWGALIAAAALVVAYVDGRTFVAVTLTSAVLIATVLPRLVRDRSPRGSDRPVAAVSVSGHGIGRHRRRSRGGATPAATSPNGDGAAPSDTEPSLSEPGSTRSRDSA